MAAEKRTRTESGLPVDDPNSALTPAAVMLEMVDDSLMMLDVDPFLLGPVLFVDANPQAAM